jgi:putative nucleotidyltransferase with HDIG domain
MDERSHDPDIRTAYERVAPTIYALTAAIDAKDSYTFIHSMNVSKYAVILAESLDMNSNDIEIIRDAGLLHDIGKISIPERILQKTSRLTDEEYAIMKTHVENSTKMIRYLPDMDYVIPAVVGHHERYDGTGYPRGLAGQNIPYMARILTIADCFDAMTAKRPYKQALSVDYAVNELEKNSGTQFDPVLVKQFIELIHEGKISIT